MKILAKVLLKTNGELCKTYEDAIAKAVKADLEVNGDGTAHVVIETMDRSSREDIT